MEGVSASNGGSGIYCDTLSVSQYDSKVRSGLADGLKQSLSGVDCRGHTRQLLNNLFLSTLTCSLMRLRVHIDVVGAAQHSNSVLFGGLSCCVVPHQHIVPKNFQKVTKSTRRGDWAPRVDAEVDLTQTCCACCARVPGPVDLVHGPSVKIGRRVVDYRHRVVCYQVVDNRRRLSLELSTTDALVQDLP